MMRRFALTMVAAAAILAACDGGPKGGPVDFDFDGPQSVAGIQFTVTVPEPETVDSVTAACAGCTVYIVRQGPRDVRGILVGDIIPGPVLTVTVSDLEMADLYTATVDEVGLADYSVISRQGFSLTGPPSE